MDLSSGFIILAVLFVWVFGLSFIVFRLYTTFSSVSKDGKKDSVVALINEVLEKESRNQKILDQLVGAYDKINKEGATHIQKIGLVRFNPFKGTSGSNQSFAAAFLDESGDGAVISSLYSREHVSTYAKPVKNLVSEYDLTPEEKDAINQAASSQIPKS